MQMYMARPAAMVRLEELRLLAQEEGRRRTTHNLCLDLAGIAR